MRKPGTDSVEQGIVYRQKTRSFVKELFRKTIHICSAFVPFFLKRFYLLTICLLVAALILYSISELLRLNGKPLPLIAKITETAARKRDENRFVLGPVTLVIGILLAAIFLPFEDARIGIFALAFGDGLASLVGRTFGRIRIPFSRGKTIAGSLACFTAIFVSSYCCTKNVGISLWLALAGMFVEVLPLFDFDNIIIPIAIGTLSYFLIA